MNPDGLPNSPRIDSLTYNKIYEKVVDNVNRYPTYFARLMAMSENFEGKTFSIPAQVLANNSSTWVAGLETLPSAATDTVVSFEYNQTAAVSNVTLPYLDLWANSGRQQVISLYSQKYGEAGTALANFIGQAIYGNGTGAPTPINGLGNIVDDGTTAATIGGLSRTTYPNLNSFVLNSGGTLTLAKMQTVDDGTTVSGAQGETTKIIVAPKTVWSLYEQLLQPAVRYQYNTLDGGLATPIQSRDLRYMPKSQMKSAEPYFETLAFRGKPMIKDEYATSGTMYFLNEKYLCLYTRNTVPSDITGQIVKVGSTDGSVYEGPTATEIKTDGWFFRKDMAAITQLGSIGYFIFVGQLTTSQPRAQGKMTSITGV